MRICAQQPPDHRLGAALRELMPDANPLRRRCDRVEAWILVALCIVFVTGGPVAAAIAGGYVYAAGLRAERISHPVSATVLSNGRRSDLGQTTSALVSWTSSGGDARVSRVHVPAAARAGSVVRAWADGSGQLTGAPPRGAELAANVAVAASFTFVALGALLMSAAVIVRHVLRRRRMAAWEADWRSIEPRWVQRS